MRQCPWCGSPDLDAEFVDIGVGQEQVTPYRCTSCDANEMNPYHDNSIATDEERTRGWWAPDREGA
jgi:hypothetical protein